MLDHFAGSTTCRIVVVPYVEILNGKPGAAAKVQADVDGDLERILPRPFLTSVLSVHTGEEAEEAELQAVFEAVEFARRMNWRPTEVKYNKRKKGASDG